LQDERQTGKVTLDLVWNGIEDDVCVIVDEWLLPVKVSDCKPSQKALLLVITELR
jgi:hypothetical protein